MKCKSEEERKKIGKKKKGGGTMETYYTISFLKQQFWTIFQEKKTNLFIVTYEYDSYFKC